MAVIDEFKRSIGRLRQKVKDQKAQGPGTEVDPKLRALRKRLKRAQRKCRQFLVRQQKAQPKKTG